MSTAIQTALANFQTLPLKDAARQFLARLGLGIEPKMEVLGGALFEIG